MLHEDFKELLILLENNEVEYLLVGGYAVSYYGYPRYTGDMDIWFNSNYENALKLIKVLNQFGFASLNINIEDLKKNKKASGRFRDLDDLEHLK